MKLRAAAFTDRGFALAERIAVQYNGQAERCGKAGRSLREWTRESFADSDALIFVGSAGIAVRAVAPYLKSKAEDPAVIVLDESGRFVIPILSGHIGGANRLALELAELLGAEPVITTATDGRGVFAVDTWAVSQGCVIPDTTEIKRVSGALLEGRSVTFASEFEIRGELPSGVIPQGAPAADFTVSVHKKGRTGLLCVPRILVLGIGCRKGTEAAKIEQLYRRILSENDLHEAALCKVCSIDVKAGEPGLLEFCEDRGLCLETYSAEQLAAVEGTFASSEFVKNTVGVDNVCERSAVLGAGNGGRLILSKTSMEGVTMAAAMMDYRPCWEI